FGTVNPIKKIIHKAHENGAIVLIDGAQTAPHSSVDVTEMDCDFYAFSGHKMLAPTGVGVLYGKSEFLESMDPFLGGGEMIQTVNMQTSTWNQIPWKFEAGTPNIAQVIGLGAAIEYLNRIGMENIHQYEQELLAYALRELAKIPQVVIYGSAPERGAVISLNAGNVHPHDLAQFLDQEQIAVRAGHHCAQPIMNKLQVSATTRVSFYLYNRIDEIDRLCKGIRSAISFMG
ncbi:MAG: aminotransferase class V-fold PLP-dependent enzyme, partial [FCB group bacterium]|nr:aminotransferase class V-fold PLP-dependent enzyme [FCB group bacterium]